MQKDQMFYLPDKMRDTFVLVLEDATVILFPLALIGIKIITVHTFY